MSEKLVRLQARIESKPEKRRGRIPGRPTVKNERRPPKVGGRRGKVNWPSLESRTKAVDPRRRLELTRRPAVATAAETLVEDVVDVLADEPSRPVAQHEVATPFMP